MSDRGETSTSTGRWRSVVRPALVLLLVGAATAVSMAWVDRPATGSGPPVDTAIADWLPIDGAAGSVRLDADGQKVPGTVENAYGTRAEVAQSISLTLGATVLAVGSRSGSSEPTADLMWRQTISPATPEAAQAISVFRVADEVSLEFDLGPDLAAVGYQPGLPLLPADVRPGGRWSGSGTILRPDGSNVAYRADFEATSAGDCLQVQSTVRGGGDPAVVGWRFCPGQGLVKRAGTGFGFAPAPRPAPASAAVAQSPASGLPAGPATSADLAVPTAAGLDQIMGTPRSSIPPFSTGDGHLVLANHALRDLLILGVTGTDAPSLTVTRRLHPGGLILTATAAADTVLATTATRALTAWDPSGSRLWSVTTADIVRQLPIMIDDQTVAVVTVNGSVTAYDRASGAIRWQATTPGAVSVPATLLPAGLAVADTSGVTVLDVRTGAVRWIVDDRIAERLGSVGDRLVVAAGGMAYGYQADTGRLSWVNRVRGLTDGIAGSDDTTVLMTGTRDLDALESTDGDRVWRIDGGCEELTASGALLICWNGGSGRMLDPVTGADRGSLELPEGALIGSVVPVLADGRLWALDSNSWRGWSWPLR